MLSFGQLVEYILCFNVDHGNILAQLVKLMNVVCLVYVIDVGQINSVIWTNE